jgi:hypothetical protein
MRLRAIGFVVAIGLVVDLGDLLRVDPEARWALWQRARQAGVQPQQRARRGRVARV